MSISFENHFLSFYGHFLTNFWQNFFYDFGDVPLYSDFSQFSSILDQKYEKNWLKNPGRQVNLDQKHYFRTFTIDIDLKNVSKVSTKRWSSWTLKKGGPLTLSPQAYKKYIPLRDIFLQKNIYIP